MREIRTALIGVGAVNRSFLEILTRKAARLQSQYGLAFRVVLAADSSGVARQLAGFDPQELHQFKSAGRRLKDRPDAIEAPLLDDFFNVLATQKDSWIPRDLPADLKIANKPGELEGVRNDSGVIFVEKRPYVLCVMTTYLRRERDGEEAISRISLVAWRMFDRIARASEYGRVISPANSSH